MPPTPRPQGARKASVKLPASSGGGSNRRLLVVLGVAGAAVIVAALGYAALAGGGDGGSAASVAPKLLEEAGCTLIVKPAVANMSDHSDFPDTDARSPKWNTDPPTSGPHYGVTVVYGAYTEPVQIGRLVHNLEHGAAYILYGNGVPDATLKQLRSFYDDHTAGTILAPYPRLGKQIALGAWFARGLGDAKSARGSGVLAKCPAFDEKAFDAFLKDFQFKGPEPFARGSLLPGNN